MTCSEKFRFLLLYMGSGDPQQPPLPPLEERARNFSKSHGPYMGSVIPSYFFIFLGLGKIPSYLIYGHKTCFYCRDLDGNF